MIQKRMFCLLLALSCSLVAEAEEAQWSGSSEFSLKGKSFLDNEINSFKKSGALVLVQGEKKTILASVPAGKLGGGISMYAQASMRPDGKVVVFANQYPPFKEVKVFEKPADSTRIAGSGTQNGKSYWIFREFIEGKLEVIFQELNSAPTVIYKRVIPPGEGDISVAHIAFSPDGKILCVLERGKDKTHIRLFGAQKGEETKDFEIDEQLIEAIPLPGGDSLLCAHVKEGRNSYRSGLFLLNLTDNTKKVIEELKTHSIQEICVSPDGFGFAYIGGAHHMNQRPIMYGHLDEKSGNIEKYVTAYFNGDEDEVSLVGFAPPQVGSSPVLVGIWDDNQRQEDNSYVGKRKRVAIPSEKKNQALQRLVSDVL